MSGVIELTEEQRQDLEALAGRDDLRTSKYAKALLETLEGRD